MNLPPASRAVGIPHANACAADTELYDDLAVVGFQTFLHVCETFHIGKAYDRAKSKVRMMACGVCFIVGCGNTDTCCTTACA